MAMDKGFSRTGMLVAGGIAAMVLIVGGILYVVSNKKSEGGASNVALGTSAQVAQADPSPKYNQILDQHNATQAGKAIKTGESYVPVFTAPATPQPAEAPKAPVAAPVQQYTQATNNQPMSAALQQQVDALRKAWEAPNGVIMVGTGQPVAAVSAAQSSAGAQAAPTPAAASAATAKKSLLGKTPIAPAVLNTAIKSDEPSVVMATITAGTMAGGVLHGEAKRAGEVINVTFSSMYLNGRYLTVNATAIDEDSMRSALTGDVDRKYMVRMGLPIILGIVSGFTTAMATPATSTVNSVFGSVTSNTSTLTGKQISAAGIAAGAQAASKIGQQAADQAKDPVVTIPQGQAIGVWFLADVLEP